MLFPLSESCPYRPGEILTYKNGCGNPHSRGVLLQPFLFADPGCRAPFRIDPSGNSDDFHDAAGQMPGGILSFRQRKQTGAYVHRMLSALSHRIHELWDTNLDTGKNSCYNPTGTIFLQP